MKTNSLIHRFGRANTRAIALIMAAFCVGIIVFSGLQQKRSVSNRLDLAVSTAQISLPDAIWNLDEAVLGQVLSALSLDEDLSFIAILSDGEILEQRQPGRAAERPFNYYENSSRFITRTADIARGGRIIGQVKIAYSQAGVWEGLAVIAASGIIVTILMIVTIGWTSKAVTRRFIFAPLGDLGHSSAAIADGRLDEPIDTGRDDEIGSLAKDLDRMRQSIRGLVGELRDANARLEEHNHMLEDRVAERTLELDAKNKELASSLERVEEANRKIVESIEYAKRIQYSLLPDLENAPRDLIDGFFVWEPRDVVGGDLYFTHADDKGYLVAVMDCTGHGVPGALMTMLASSAIRQVVVDEGCLDDPAEILSRMSQSVKTSLRQDTDGAHSDDGLDASVCYVDHTKKQVTFAGARLPLYYRANGQINVVKGDRQSLGYKKSHTDFSFTNHHIPWTDDLELYLATDGMPDQLGGEQGLPFGHRRLLRLLDDTAHLSFQDKEQRIRESFDQYVGRSERLDDITLVGFAVDGGVNPRTAQHAGT